MATPVNQFALGKYARLYVAPAVADGSSLGGGTGPLTVRAAVVLLGRAGRAEGMHRLGELRIRSVPVLGVGLRSHDVLRQSVWFGTVSLALMITA